MGKLQGSRAESFTQGHTASVWEIWRSNPGLLIPKIGVFFSPVLFSLGGIFGYLKDDPCLQPVGHLVFLLPILIKGHPSSPNSGDGMLESTVLFLFSDPQSLWSLVGLHDTGWSGGPTWCP